MPTNSADSIIIKYLVELYLNGKRVNDSKYNKILQNIIIKTKQISNMDAKINLIYNTLGPCTLITYPLYTDLLRKLFAKNHVSDSMIRNLLLCINDKQNSSTVDPIAN